MFIHQFKVLRVSRATLLLVVSLLGLPTLALAANTMQDGKMAGNSAMMMKDAAPTSSGMMKQDDQPADHKMMQKDAKEATHKMMKKDTASMMQSHDKMAGDSTMMKK